MSLKAKGAVGGRMPGQIAAVLCLLGSLLAAPWVLAAPATAANPVVGEYTARAAAEARAGELRQQGKRVEVVRVSKAVTVDSLEIGYYRSFAQAEAAEMGLRRKGIHSTGVRRTVNGYAVGLGEFVNHQDMERQLRYMRGLGYRNVQTVGLVEMRDSYQVVELSLPQASGEREQTTTVTTKGGGAAKERVQFEFRSRARAQRKVEQFKKQGVAAAISRRHQTLHLKSLVLRVYQEWSDAKRVADRLQQHGIDARVINDPVERGYDVTAGAFRSEANLRDRYRKIEKMGFKSISVLPVEVSLVTYTVTATVPRAVAGTSTAKTKGEEQASQSGAGPQVLVFGSNPESFAGYGKNLETTGTGEPKFSASLDDVRLEAGGLTQRSRPVNGTDYLHAAASLHWHPDQRWSFRLAGRVDGYYQSGNPHFSQAQADYGDTFVRYRGDNLRVTLGAQTVIWGRVDEIPPTDRLSVQDLRRYALDDLPDRRLAVPALRVEKYHRGYKVDFLWEPDFRPAKLPDINSIWSPVDRVNGRFIGIKSSPLVAPMIQNGSFGEDKHGEGGAGVRISHSGETLDYAVTVQRARRSLPYYRMNEAAREALLSSLNPTTALAASTGDTFVAIHPWSWVFGGDLGFQAHGATWRFEAAYLSDVPVTTTDLRVVKVKGLDWVAGVEFYPGDANTRVNLQLAGHQLFNTPAILDRKHVYLMDGSVEDVFHHSRWRAKLRFSFGLNKRDVYLNPELAYIGWEPNQFYIGAHYFDGAAGTQNGFYKHDSIIVVGWRAHF